MNTTQHLHTKSIVVSQQWEKKAERYKTLWEPQECYHSVFNNMTKTRISLICDRGGGRNHPPSSKNRIFSATEDRMKPRPVCKFEFCRFGPVEKKLERSISLGLVVAARQSRVGSKFRNLKILNFFASTSKFYNKSRTPFLISSPNT